MGTATGGIIGAIIGFLVGGFIPAKGDITASFLSRGVRGMFSTDPIGMTMSFVFVMLGITAFALMGAFIGNSARRLKG